MALRVCLWSGFGCDFFIGCGRFVFERCYFADRNVVCEGDFNWNCLADCGGPRMLW